MRPQGVLGIFGDMDLACDAVRTLKGGAYPKLTVLSPAAHHELEHAVGDGGAEKSNVKWFTTVGALTGLTCATALTMWTSQDWPLVTGGKPVLISPGYLVIMFELTVLFAAIFSLSGFILLSRLPHTRLRVGYDPRFSDDKIGIWLPAPRDRWDEAAKALKANGAEEVKFEAS